MTNEEVREHMDMLIAHKDRALETHPYFKRCNCCIHSEEQDGTNCYECVEIKDDLKGDNMGELFDNFTIKEIAESMFEYVVEEVEDWTDLCYEDLSSPSKERYLKLVKEQLELLFTEEFQRIKDKANESEEIKRIRRENEELKRRLAMLDMDFVEDMGK